MHITFYMLSRFNVLIAYWPRWKLKRTYHFYSHHLRKNTDARLHIKRYMEISFYRMSLVILHLVIFLIQGIKINNDMRLQKGLHVWRERERNFLISRQMSSEYNWVSKLPIFLFAFLHKLAKTQIKWQRKLTESRYSVGSKESPLLPKACLTPYLPDGEGIA